VLHPCNERGRACLLLSPGEMRAWLFGSVLLLGCSSSMSSPDGDAAPPAPDAEAAEDSPSSADTDGQVADGGEGGADAQADATCVFTVDDAGVTHGCGKGAQGPGDKDDGGGAPPPPPPDAALDASGLPLGAPCWDNAQCVSTMCFDYAVKGTFCTQRCWTDGNCPPPLLGCNGMGVCRVP
jgi:hypothetical protein